MAQEQDIKLVACTMTMDLLGLRKKNCLTALSMRGSRIWAMLRMAMLTCSFKENSGAFAVIKRGNKDGYSQCIVHCTYYSVCRLENSPAQGVRQITAAQLKQELKDRNANKQFIDVRTPGEFKGNHIRGFRNIPLDQLLSSGDSLSKTWKWY